MRGLEVARRLVPFAACRARRCRRRGRSGAPRRSVTASPATRWCATAARLEQDRGRLAVEVLPHRGRRTVVHRVRVDRVAERERRAVVEEHAGLDRLVDGEPSRCPQRDDATSMRVGSEDRDREHDLRRVRATARRASRSPRRRSGGSARLAEQTAGLARRSLREGLDEQRIAAARRREVAGAVDGRAGFPLACELGGLERRERVEVHDRGARLGAQAGDAVGGPGARGSARVVASTRSGTCSSSRRKRRWRRRSTVAASAQSTSSTKSTVGVARTCSRTRPVSAKSWRVRSRWIASGVRLASGA